MYVLMNGINVQDGYLGSAFGPNLGPRYAAAARVPRLSRPYLDKDTHVCNLSVSADMSAFLIFFGVCVCVCMRKKGIVCVRGTLAAALLHTKNLVPCLTRLHSHWLPDISFIDNK